MKLERGERSLGYIIVFSMEVQGIDDGGTRDGGLRLQGIQTELGAWTR